MSERRFRVLAVCSHPVQYMAPLLRRMAREPELDLSVAYCSLKGAKPSYDSEFQEVVQWDVPLLDGYAWQEIPNWGSEGYLGLFNPGLSKLIRRGSFDAVLSYLSYRSASFWIAYSACYRSGAAFVFGTDANNLAPRDASFPKLIAKKIFWPWLFSLADQVIVPSSSGRELMRSLNIPDDRITLTPYSVDNDWWIRQSQQVDRYAIRTSWGATPETCVVLFCAKLQPWKRPQDLLQAFSQANLSNGLLVFAGEGSERAELEKQARSLGLTERVRFLGFVNQSELPAVYTGADLMVLPSEYEPFAVVVNEASLCGCPVIASDRVGAAKDLIQPVDPRLIFPCGDIGALASLLAGLCRDPNRLAEQGRAARERMTNWSPQDNIKNTIEAVRRGVDHKHRSFSPPRAHDSEKHEA